MPQSYSEFQLQRNRITGQMLGQIATRVVLIGVDIFKFLLGFIATLIKSLTGK